MAAGCSIRFQVFTLSYMTIHSILSLGSPRAGRKAGAIILKWSERVMFKTCQLSYCRQSLLMSINAYVLRCARRPGTRNFFLYSTPFLAPWPSGVATAATVLYWPGPLPKSPSCSTARMPLYFDYRGKHCILLFIASCISRFTLAETHTRWI